MGRVCYVPCWLWVEFTMCRVGYGLSLLCAELVMGQVCYVLS